MWLLVLLLLSVGFLVFATVRLRLHPFLALLAAALGYGLFCGRLAPGAVVEAVNTGFGATLGQIGIVILAGTIIGTFLERSGGALRLAEALLRMTGRRNVPLTMGLIGYVVSVPVFCDSGFVILSPLGKALSRRTGTPLAASAIALSLGLYATHTMAPPTPGPVAAAAILEADLGRVILWGLLVSLTALGAGILFAVHIAGRVTLENDAPEEVKSPEPQETPSAGRSAVPILLPLLLIVLRSVAGLPARPLGEGTLAAGLDFLGQPMIALLAGMILAFGLPRMRTRDLYSASGWVGDAVVAASGIILITGAGGAFGKVLQSAGIADVVQDSLGGAQLGIVLPFLVAAALKTAQGSSTVAIITTAGIMAPLLEPFGLDAPSVRALVVVAIGAGAMVVSHANDSFFWVVTQFSGMSVSQGYRLQSLGSLVVGLTAALAVWLCSLMVL